MGHGLCFGSLDRMLILHFFLPLLLLWGFIFFHICGAGYCYKFKNILVLFSRTSSGVQVIHICIVCKDNRPLTIQRLRESPHQCLFPW